MFASLCRIPLSKCHLHVSMMESVTVVMARMSRMTFHFQNLPTLRDNNSNIIACFRRHANTDASPCSFWSVNRSKALKDSEQIGPKIGNWHMKSDLRLSVQLQKQWSSNCQKASTEISGILSNGIVYILQYVQLYYKRLIFRYWV